MYKDRIPHQVFSVILNTASLILETLQLRIEPGFVDFFLIFRFPQLLMIIVERGDLRSSSPLSAPGDQPFCQESALLHFETLGHSVTLFATV